LCAKHWVITNGKVSFPRKSTQITSKTKVIAKVGKDLAQELCKVLYNDIPKYKEAKIKEKARAQFQFPRNPIKIPID
jgi:hypothetical protein